jgi:hypothetical protein
MFKLKSTKEIFGLHKFSEHGVPVFEKNLGPGIVAEANKDGSIFINKGTSDDIAEKAIAHEKVHLDQMNQGKLDYDDKTVTWKKNNHSPARVYLRSNMQEGGAGLEWEKEAYRLQDTKLKK